MYSSTGTLDYADAETSRQKHGLRLRLRDFFLSKSGKKSRVHVIEESMFLIFLIDLIEFFLSRVLIDFFGVGF